MGATDDLVPGKNGGAAKAPSAAPDPDVIRVTIDMNMKTGALTIVEGPAQNRVLFYGILELAKDAIFRSTLGKQQPQGRVLTLG